MGEIFALVLILIALLGPTYRVGAVANRRRSLPSYKAQSVSFARGRDPPSCSLTSNPSTTNQTFANTKAGPAGCLICRAAVPRGISRNTPSTSAGSSVLNCPELLFVSAEHVERFVGSFEFCISISNFHLQFSVANI